MVRTYGSAQTLQPGEKHIKKEAPYVGMLKHHTRKPNELREFKDCGVIL